MAQGAENRYETMKLELQKLLENKQKIEENLKLVQQDLHKERLKGGEVRNEMTVIHKALDACEAELTVLRQEKQGLQLKVKEETSRNNILNEEKFSLLKTLDEIKKSEVCQKFKSNLFIFYSHFI